MYHEIKRLTITALDLWWLISRHRVPAALARTTTPNQGPFPGPGGKSLQFILQRKKRENKGLADGLTVLLISLFAGVLLLCSLNRRVVQAVFSW